ncbi:MAG TPA: hypothetical protein VGF45_05190 [Polyangia bacterium]
MGLRSLGSCHLKLWVVLSLAIFSAALNTSVADSGTPSATSALDEDEERCPTLMAIARKFNPAMALPIRDVWPVEVRYAWHDGSDLVAQAEGDATPTTAVKSADLDRVDWSRLPHKTADGRALRYYIDAPGDDRPSDDPRRSRWRKRFAEITKATDASVSPAHSAYKPTQYVHAFWWNRKEGLLAIQYWFYYPFNEWVNHHEGDWEHIQIVLNGPSRIEPGANFVPVDYHYFFHEFQMSTKDVKRVASANPEGDHPVVYVGGRGDWFGYGGELSGGSYPQPGRYAGSAFSVSWLSPEEDTSQTERFLAASDFQLILLPEPSRLDAKKSPELSWLRLPFYAGQRSVYVNPPGFGGVSGRPPLQPAARADWGKPSRRAKWQGQPLPGVATTASLPGGWACAVATNPRTCATL